MAEVHPFLAAVEAAYREHGFPADVYSMSVVSYSSNRFAVHLCGHKASVTHLGMGETFADAVAEAHAAKHRAEDKLAGARQALIDAGYDPSLLKDEA